MENQENTQIHNDIKKLVGLLEKQSAMASNRKTEEVSTSSSISQNELNQILGNRRKNLFKTKPVAVTTGQ